ncbi:MAG: hypothetical protein WA484_00215 [Solirubrobacteraceae bacterium]
MPCRVLPRSISGRSDGTAGSVLPAGEAEAFHLIRAHMRYFNVDRELRTLMVVSAAPGDGKTTVARHLASAAARMGSQVLLLETDLRRPMIAQQLGIMLGRGRLPAAQEGRRRRDRRARRAQPARRRRAQFRDDLRGPR